MPITDADLEPGARFTAPEGMSIKPVEMVVRVAWVDRERDVIHYYKEGSPEMRQTTIDRFLSIVRAKTG